MRIRSCFMFLSLALACAGSFSAPAASPEAIISTFSCVGFDPETGDIGVAVQSKFFAVGAVVPWARAGSGAIATQAFGNTTYGPSGLDMLAEGASPEEVIRILTEADSIRTRRQVGVVDARGRSATYTGSECIPFAGGKSGLHYAVQGNILASPAVIDSMAHAFETSKGWLGDRLLASLEAGQAAGGDSRGMQSAALIIVRQNGGYAGYNDRYCDLRVDDAGDPIRELRRLYEIWKRDALILEGYREVEQARYARAYALGEEAARLAPAEGEPLYHLACFHARGGELDTALSFLHSAIARQPALVAQARQDPDLAPLRDRDAFRNLLETGGAGSDKR